MLLGHTCNHFNSTSIYTDDSKSDAGIGFGVFSNDFSIKGALSVSTLVFSSKLKDILTALEKGFALRQSNITAFTIFSNSESVLQVLVFFNPVHPYVLKVLELLHILRCQGELVEFCWVPSHVNVIGNERANTLAKNAAANLIARRCPLPHGDFILVAARNSWQFFGDFIKINKMKEIASLTIPLLYVSPLKKRESSYAYQRLVILDLVMDI